MADVGGASASRRDLRDAEVEDLEDSLARVLRQKEVRRLEVAVDDPGRVRLRRPRRTPGARGRPRAAIEEAARATRSSASRSRPRRSSMTMYGRPRSSVSTSSTCTTCGPRMRALARASRSKRSTASGSASTSWRRNLIATLWRRRRCSASNTRPMPPSPSGRSSRYLPLTTSPADGIRDVPSSQTTEVVSILRSREPVRPADIASSVRAARMGRPRTLSRLSRRSRPLRAPSSSRQDGVRPARRARRSRSVG